jgi:hypothetical protein
MKLRHDSAADAVGGAGVLYRLEKNVSLAGAGEPGGTFAAVLNVGKQFLPLAGRDLVIDIAGY